MTKKQIKRDVDIIRAKKREVTKSREAALEFLRRAGIATKKGNLKKVYR